MNKILGFSVLLLAMSCSSISKTIKNGEFLVLSKDEINKYFVFKAKIHHSINDSEIILLSEKKGNCNYSNKIKVGSHYDFKLKELVYIEIEDSISVSLIRGQSVNGIELSDGNKLPYLIENSCNGKIKVLADQL